VDYVSSTKVPPKGPHIFLFHPHGVFALANGLHVGTELTDWSTRPIKGTALNALRLLPFGQELFDKLHFVPSNYDDMKSVLDNNESLTICLGGAREILETKAGHMRLSIKKKRGAFRLALQKGVPIVPVISYGENELFELMDSPILSWMHQKLIHYGLYIYIPTFKSCKKWYGILTNPLAEPIRSVVGEAIEVPEAHEPTEREIDELRERYFVDLNELYRKTRPSTYAEDLIIV
jgi:hypothetical protein